MGCVLLAGKTIASFAFSVFVSRDRVDVGVERIQIIAAATWPGSPPQSSLLESSPTVDNRFGGGWRPTYPPPASPPNSGSLHSGCIRLSVRSRSGTSNSIPRVRAAQRGCRGERRGDGRDRLHFLSRRHRGESSHAQWQAVRVSGHG